MIVSSTLQHLTYVRRTQPLKPTLAATFRCLRGLLYFRAHRELLGTGIVMQYIRRAAHSDLFYHVTHRHYLATFLSLRERTELALFHMRCEDRKFSDNYKDAVYLKDGLVLWEKVVDGARFAIRLRMASRAAQEGDLEVALMVDEQRLHSFRFTLFVC